MFTRVIVKMPAMDNLALWEDTLAPTKWAI